MSDYKTVFDAQPAKFPESSPHAQPALIPPDNPRIFLRRCPHLLPLYGISLPPLVRTMGAGASDLDCIAYLSVFFLIYFLFYFGPQDMQDLSSPNCDPSNVSVES